MSKVSNPFISVSRPVGDARLRLFCFPHAGGGASLFRLWHAGLPARVEVCGVQLPGREGRWREEPFTEMGALLGALAPAIIPLCDVPFALFGHSMGALVAFELVRELRRRGLRAPAHLFISGRRAPRTPERGSDIHRLPDAEFLEQIVSRYEGIPKIILEEPELLRVYLRALRADFALLETHAHRPGPPLDCPVSVISGLDDPSVTLDELLAWRTETAKFFRLELLPGDHFYFQKEPAQLLRSLSRDLAPPPGG
ncbi:MAG TPA: alpha/beta fold hydrolase [Pyrinomonadaceae bacterium]|jgi:myxalamid-type polyketide synthase MxaE and MxaD/epothilone polyketide synthase D